MTDPRFALTPEHVTKLWTAIELHSTAIAEEYLTPTDRIPGASTMTHSCIYTSAAILVDAGLRPSELAALLWTDVQGIDSAQAWINIAAVNSKSHRARQLSCTARLTRRLALHRAMQRKTPTPHPSSVLHAYPKQSAQITTRTIQRWITGLTQQILGATVRPYDLRHTYATLLLRVADIETVRQALGHRHLTTTQRYLHTQPQTHREAAAAFETATTKG